MATTPSDKFRELLHDFGVGMLVTRCKDDSLRARPMNFAEVEDDGTFWFLTEKRSGKSEEITTDEHVNITLQSSSKFVSISGRGTLVDDLAKVAELWKEPWKVWFPGGKDDPNLALLKVSGDSGEYWDNSGSSGIKYLIEAGKAYLSGTKPDVANDPKIHGRVNL